MKNISKSSPEYDYLLKNSEKSDLPTFRVPDGSTAYIVDTKELLIFYDGQWYEM